MGLSVSCRVPLLLLIGLAALHSKPISIIERNGAIASSRDLISISTRSGEQSRVVVSIGCRSSRKNSLLNKAFGTNFDVLSELKLEEESTLVSIDGSLGLIVLNCDGVNCEEEAKSTALTSEVADVVLMNIYQCDIGRCISSNVSALKAVLSQRLSLKNESSNSVDAEPLPFIVAVHDCDPDADEKEIEKLVASEIDFAWNELDSKKDLSKYISLSVSMIPHPRYAPDLYTTASILLRDKITTSTIPSVTASFPSRLRAILTTKMNSPPPPMADSEMGNALAIERAFSECVTSAEGTLNVWRLATSKGKVIASFGFRSNALYQKIMDTFDKNTLSIGGSLRIKKRSKLVTFLESGIIRLFKQQVSTLVRKSMGSFKRQMVHLMNAEKLNEESEATLLRKTLYDFESRASELQPEFLADLSFEEEYEEFEADLCDYMERFSDSPPAQARALAKVEKQVMKSVKDEDRPGRKRRRSKRSITAGLNLVAFIRQEGLGNLQAFGGYRQGPHTITVGYSNDASTPEAMQDGEPPPLLRLQPKLHLDIDL